MKRHWRVVSVVALAVVAAALGIRHTLSAKPVPVYEGRTAQAWMQEMYTTNQTAAIQALREMGTNAFPALIQILGKKHSSWDRLNIWIYGRLPRALKARWRPPISDNEQQDIFSAAEFVLTNDRHARQVLPDLVRILKDKDCPSRACTLVLVANLVKPGDSNCAPVLIAGLAETDFGLRYQVFHGLARLGPSARAAVPALTAALRDPKLDIRTLAAYTLWKVDGQTNVAIAAFKAALNSTEPTIVGGWSSINLAQLDPNDPSLIPVFIRNLENHDDGLRLGAVSALGRYGRAASAAVPALTNLLASANSGLRQRVLSTLKRIDPETALKYEAK